MKPLSKYKNEKLKVYSGAPIKKGFYKRNLNKAYNLYIGQTWQPSGLQKVKKTQRETFSQKIDNYMKDYKKFKKKYNFPIQKDNSIIIEKDYDEFEAQKMILLNKISDNFDNYLEKDFFQYTDNLINYIDENNDNEISLLKTTQTLKDYNNRLYLNINNIQSDVNSILNEKKDKKDKIMLYNITNEEKIEENNDEQFDEINEENIMGKNEKGKKENIDEKNDDILKKENCGNNEKKDVNQDNKIKAKEDNDLMQDTSNNNKNEKDFNLIQDNDKDFKECTEIPLFQSIIKNDYIKAYSPHDYFNEQFKKNLEEIEKLNKKETNVKIDNENDNEYNNEFNNLEIESQHESKVESEINRAQIIGNDEDYEDEEYKFEDY